MKKKLFAAALLVGILAILGIGSQAYYTKNVTVHNVITTGSIGIRVEEHQLVDGKLEPYPTGPVKVMPGKAVSKIVTIHNDQADCFVRACVEIVVTDAEGNTNVLSPEGIVHLDMNTAKWKQKPGESKWWYYDGIVHSHDSSLPLLNSVTFDGEAMGNVFQGATIRINIAAQAVQAANNGTNVLTAQGWPGEPIL